MSGTEYVLWFILMAIGIALILGLGTLKMAGLLHRPTHREPAPEEAPRADAEIHHWYDRFIHHHAA